MMHADEAVAMLRNAKPFDRSFIDEMIPYHQGAIRIARAVLADGEDAETRAASREEASSSDRRQ